MDDGIFELRGKVGSDISRVLYFFYYEGKIILTNGFVKKTQKHQNQRLNLPKHIEKTIWKGVAKMKKFEDFLAEQLQDEEFKKEYAKCLASGLSF